MKKKLLLILSFLLFGSIFMITDAHANAAIMPINYYEMQEPNYPMRTNQTTSYQNRFLWSNNQIYTKVDCTHWIMPGWEGSSWTKRSENGKIWGYRNFSGTDNFLLKNLGTGQIIANWSWARADMSGQQFDNWYYGKHGYRIEFPAGGTWLPVGGATPNNPTGYFTRTGTNYYYNVSGTSSNLTSFKADFWHSSGVYEDTGDFVSAQVEDPVVGFQYIIDQNPATEVTLYNSTYSPNGNINVSPYFISNQTWYIHIKTRSYTNLLSGRVDRPLRDASLMKTLTLTGDAGINTVTGAGSYYPGQTVNINATLKPTGVKWKGWIGTGSPFDQAYTFTMPDTNVSYHATTTKCSYVLELNGNGNTGGNMLLIG